MPRWAVPLLLIGVAVLFRVFGDAEMLGAGTLALGQLISAIGAALSIQIAFQER